MTANLLVQVKQRQYLSFIICSAYIEMMMGEVTLQTKIV